MPRKSRKPVEATSDTSESVKPSASTPPQAIDEATHTVDAAADVGRRIRSFKSTLSFGSKGVAMGERNGHDWVITFPEDPGRETKDRLIDAGFAYHDGKWKAFSHAANRPQIETLAKALKREAGDEVTFNDYPVRQVVLAFDAPPADDIKAQLREGGFHYRSDRTWNADNTPRNQRFARDLIQSLPDISRSASTGR